ncbi:MAG: PASTA domain-containing protein [Bacteroidota bacterium]
MNSAFTRFLISKTFFKHLGIALGIGIVLILLILVTLRVYTHHGEAYSVPNMVGLTLEEVKKVAEEYELRYEVIDSVYLQEYEPGTVVEHIPEADFKVKENRKVFLTMNAVTLEMVRVPRVINVSLRQAEAMLLTQGLRLGELQYKPDIAKNYVLEQLYKGKSVEPGDSIPKGSSIDLVLGTGIGNKNANVPNLIGVTYDKASEITKNAYLNLGDPIYDNSILTEEDSISARIFKQKPVPRISAKIPLGSYIDVWLTIDTVKIEEALLQIQENYYE